MSPNKELIQTNYERFNLWVKKKKKKNPNQYKFDKKIWVAILECLGWGWYGTLI